MMMKRLLSLLMALALVMGCAAAFAEGDAAAETAAEAAAPVVLATVDGKEITDQNPFMVNLVNYYQSMYSMYGIDMSDPEMMNYLKGIGLER